MWPERTAAGGASTGAEGPGFTVKALRNGWRLFSFGRLAGTPFRLILVQPQTGVALLELEPGWTPGAMTLFRRTLEEAGFFRLHPGFLPVIHRSVKETELAHLDTMLNEAFVGLDPIHVAAEGRWADTLERILTAGSAAPLVTASDGRGAGPRWRLVLLAGGGLALAGAALIAGPLLLRGAPPGAPPSARPDGGIVAAPPAQRPSPVAPEAIPRAEPPGPELAEAPRPSVLPVEPPAARVEPLPVIVEPPALVAPAAEPPPAIISAPPPVLAPVVEPPPEPPRAPVTERAEPPRAINSAPPPVVAPAVEPPPAPPPRPVVAEAEPPPVSMPLPPPVVPPQPAAEPDPPPVVAAAEEPAPAPPPVVPPLAELGPAPPAVVPPAPAPAIETPAAAAALPEPAPVPAPPPVIEPGEVPRPAAADAGPSLSAEAAPAPSPPAPLPAARAPEPAPPPAAPRAAARPPVDPALAEAMQRRGEALLRVGDISGARRFFQRAAEGGSAAAALAMAETFDPRVLARSAVVGMQPDRAAALLWYRRAADLGSPDAAERTATLEAEP